MRVLHKLMLLFFGVLKFNITYGRHWLGGTFSVMSMCIFSIYFILFTIWCPSWLDRMHLWTLSRVIVSYFIHIAPKRKNFSLTYFSAKNITFNTPLFILRLSRAYQHENIRCFRRNVSLEMRQVGNNFTYRWTYFQINLAQY